MPRLYDVAGVLVRLLLFLLTDWQVRGRENVPVNGGVIVVANHLNLADPPVLGASLGRRAVFMAKKELFRSRFLSFIIRSFGAFPVGRGELNRQALRQADQVLARGLALIIFPEGSRSRDARLQPALPGSALIALRNNIPVLPVGITGTEKIRGAGWWLRRPKIVVNIGRPFQLPPVEGSLTRAKRRELTDAIMSHIARLLPVAYQGNYAQRRD
jgi:1-acyl-sn-glycerol-3-phosphate acyltransferase